MTYNIRLDRGGHDQAIEDDFPSLTYWDAAKDDVASAVMSAEHLLGTPDFDRTRRWLDGADRGQAVIKLADLILTQRRFYIEGASQSLVEEMI